MDAKPLLLTMGDACGIGPEILVHAFRSGQCGGAFVLGDMAVMRRAAELTGGLFPLALIERPCEAPHCPPGCVPVLQASGLPADLLAAPLGQVDWRAGAAAAACIRQAVTLALAGEVLALVTAPIHKEALAAAGVAFPGHTEMLQAWSGAGPVRMMLANDELRTVLVTIHVSLRRAIDLITFDAVLETLRIAHRAAAGWGVPAPRIGVAGLNPHAGEGGLFGSEELTIIAPAIASARAVGIDVHGPFAPDTVFMRARRGEFDIVVAMTHDHGLIPVKYLGVEQGVIVTLGLPFVRTSPDHGTAFDIAGRGVADSSSLLAALKWARRLGGATPHG
jgi:4-hydroxythreonine-4-phosphate dehydrogenase